MGETKSIEQLGKDLKIKWYRTRLDPAVLKSLTRKSDLQGTFQAGGHLLIYVALGALGFWFWSHHLWALFAACLWLHGASTTFFHGTSTHELMHGTVFKSKKLNTIFLYIYSLLGWWDPVDYSASHRYHHFYTLYPAADRENVLRLPPVPGFFLIVQMFTVNLFAPPGRTFGAGGFFATVCFNLRLALGMKIGGAAPSMEWIQALHADNPQTERKAGVWARALLLFHAGIVAAGIISGLWVLPLLITLSPFIANIVSYAVGIAMHSGMMVNEPDFRKIARSMRLNPIVSFLYWRMNWHLVHHMYAAIPCYNLKKMHTEIAHDVPEAKGFFRTWRELLDIARAKKKDPSYVFLPPLPATAVPYDEVE